jgi:hypothetical protein
MACGRLVMPSPFLEGGKYIESRKYDSRIMVHVGHDSSSYDFDHQYRRNYEAYNCSSRLAAVARKFGDEIRSQAN